jgi:hypothetical protein
VEFVEQVCHFILLKTDTESKFTVFLWIKVNTVVERGKQNERANVTGNETTSNTMSVILGEENSFEPLF